MKISMNMADLNHLIGITISSKDPQLQSKVADAKSMELGWIQIYIEPETKEEHLIPVKDSGLEIAVHCAHEDHMFMPTRGDDDTNRRLFDEAVESARYLESKIVIIHPGCITEKEYTSDFNSLTALDERYSRFVKYAKDKSEGFRVLVENLPRWLGKDRGIFSFAVDPFYREMEDAGFGFCLDLANVATDFNGFPANYLYPPTERVSFPNSDSDIRIISNSLDSLALQRLSQLRENHLGHVKDFLSLEPEALHIRGLNYWHTMRPKARQPEPMSDLNATQLQIVIPYCIVHKAPILIESLDPNQQRSDVAFINQEYARIAQTSR